MNNLIDVVVPVYNVENYLDKFFTSLYSQTFSSFRVIIVYDNSDDNSYDLLLKYQVLFGKSRFTIIESEKKDGLGAARDLALNSGILSCEYITFLDPDDWIENNYFEKMVSRIRETDSDICVCGFRRVLDFDNSVVNVDMVNNPDVINDVSKYYATPFFNTAVWNKLYKYDLVKNIRFTNVKRSEDVCFFAQTFLAAKRVCFVNEPLYNYLIRGNSLAATYSIEHVNELLNLVNVVSKSLDDSQKRFFADILFVRLSVGTVFRITSNDVKNGKYAAKMIRKFLLKNFAHFCFFKNLKLKQALKGGKLLMFAYFIRKLYRFSSLFCIIKLYCRRVKKHKKVLSW